MPLGNRKNRVGKRMEGGEGGEERGEGESNDKVEKAKEKEKK